MRQLTVFAILTCCLYASVPARAARGMKTFEITFHSDPEGATLYADHEQRNFGYTPVTLVYVANNNLQDGLGCQTLQPVMVRWASGAETHSNSLMHCAATGRTGQFTFVRPEGLDGREFDVSFAMFLMQLGATRENLREQIRADWGRMFAAHAASTVDQMRTVACTTTAVGSTIYTRCR
jgi:hypothetical protein